ncbi:hypothetical protein AAC387_Pa10g1212 [Persea americana]
MLLSVRARRTSQRKVTAHAGRAGAVMSWHSCRAAELALLAEPRCCRASLSGPALLTEPPNCWAVLYRDRGKGRRITVILNLVIVVFSPHNCRLAFGL